MEPSKTEDDIHEVHVIETDQAAVSATVCRLELYTCVISAICITVAIWAFCIYVPLSHNPLFHKLLAILIGTSLVLLGILHFLGPFCLSKMDVLIGNDFIAGPDPGSLLLGHKTILGYSDIVQVNLDISKGQITGATVVGKGLVIISVRRVTELQTVIRAIREHTGPEVQWRRSPPRFTKLSGDNVDSLIDKGEKNNFDEQQ